MNRGGGKWALCGHQTFPAANQKPSHQGSPQVLSMEVGSSGFGGVAQETLWDHIPVELGHFLEFAQDGFTAN